MMTDPNLCRPAPWRGSVSESDNDPMNSTANPRVTGSCTNDNDYMISSVYTN